VIAREGAHAIWLEPDTRPDLDKVMSKLPLVLLCALLLLVGAASPASADVLKTGKIYQAVFSQDYRAIHSMDDDSKYYIRIVQVSSTNPNWVQIEFPADANPSYNSSLAGKRWLNLNYVIELKPQDDQ
jgi:hypothetical protein